MSVKTKLYGAFSAIIVMSIIMAIFGIFELRSVNEASTGLVQENIPRIDLIATINKAQADHRRLQLAHINAENEQQMASYEATIVEEEKEIDEALQKYLELTNAKDKTQKIINEWNNYKSVAHLITEASRSNDDQEAMRIATTSRKAFEQLSEDLNELKQMNIQLAEQESAEGDAKTSRVIWIYIALLVLMIIASIIITYKLSGYMLKMLNGMCRATDLMKNGDFRITPRTLQSNDEFGVMADSLIAMRDNINATLRKIHEAAETVAASSQELTASADQSAQVTETVAQSITEVASKNDQQSESVNTVSAAVQEISASVEEIAANANMASNHASEASQVANAGGDSIKAAINQMHAIETVVTQSAGVVNELGERSKEIGMIVETITGIAEQTNLLALNAAIEAARAGEQGRGFAVVAEEVRKLAAESQEAAEQISTLIGKIQKQTDGAVRAMNSGTEEVQKGAAVVRESGEAFERIIELNNGVAEQVKGIAHTTEEAAKASTEVIGAVQNVDESARHVAEETQTVSAATEEQSASMEEIASSSRNLADVAQNLNLEVNKFKI